MNCSRPQSWLRAEGRTPRLSKGREGQLLTMAQQTSEPRAPSEVVYYNPSSPPPGVGSVSPAGVGAGPGLVLHQNLDHY